MQAQLGVPAESCWTGSLALWLPFPARDAAAAAGFASLKTAAAGQWLKSGVGGVLSVVLRPERPPLLTFRGLRSVRSLVEGPLPAGGFAFAIHCAEHAAEGGSVLFLRLCGRRAGQPTTCTLAVRFDLAAAALECGALLQAIVQGRVAAAAAPGPSGAAAPAASGPASPGPPEEGEADGADLLQAVQAYLRDPEFAAYVGRLERLWEELEEEGEAALLAASKQH